MQLSRAKLERGGEAVTLTKVEYTFSILQKWKYTSKSMFEVYLKYTSSILHLYSSILRIYLKYTSSTRQPVQPIELKQKNYTSSLDYFHKRSTFEANCEIRLQF